MTQTDNNNVTKFEPGDIVEVESSILLVNDSDETINMAGHKGKVLTSFRNWQGSTGVLVDFGDFAAPILTTDITLQQKAAKPLRQITEEKVEPMKRENDTASCTIDPTLYRQLRRLGILDTSVRSHNVGESDYSQRIIQPWSIILEYRLNYWDGDIIKRVLRHKQTDPRRLDYEKIIHICEERIRQIEAEEEG